ncbi:small-conductance mechanosensitive channel [Rubidibacter lacunae KORDI 51-2]|uniref:Small-conductance mechanosensitive channel n=1 Tax=Rubidibacter lacunae KORDI 51-2 TaxID=582515 RepID=U5DH43_9CHRO|nr:mechanosensitive ion channel domain-containing protein [Rubidibacter lacunae]ERN40916.1 small-conductance mechanosensitive channel [Rubidibacter lacunae KORDI 51-2]
MDIIPFFQDLLGIEFTPELKAALIRRAIVIGLFLLLASLSWIVGQFTPRIARFTIHRFSPHKFSDLHDNLIDPIKGAFRSAGTLILISISSNVLRPYQGLLEFIRFFLDLSVILSVAWLASRLFRQFVRFYGIELIRNLGLEIDELLLVVETIANIIIGFIAAIAFAQSQEINLVGLLASLGVGGLAIAFAAQKTLEQLLGTVVIYLDRPFAPGEYIRMPSGTFGRVESIGLRSTKIRTAAKSTLLIVPNSTMANLEVENVTRGKKVMAMLYLDFATLLADRDKALVEQVIQESTDSLFGIDPGSTRINLSIPNAELNGTSPQHTRARVTFFILGSSENSVQLRKRLLELANEKVSKKLSSYGIEFTTNEPTIYVESPITI